MEEQPVLLVSPYCDIRGTDSYGAGYYQAPRGNRRHNGVDIVCEGGTIILSATDGKVTRCEGIVYSDPEKQDWRYVEIEDNNGVKIRYFYVKALDIDMGLKVQKGDAIGVAQGIETLYKGITPHIHLETRISKHNYLDPIEYLLSLESQDEPDHTS